MTAVLNGSSTAWMEDPRRACRDQPREWFFPVVSKPGGGDDPDGLEEPPWPLSEAKLCCQICPVRTECLSYALITEQEWGTWGGMSGYQRALITKPRARKSCPGCAAHEIVQEREHEICLACGVSWPML